MSKGVALPGGFGRTASADAGLALGFFRQLGQKFWREIGIHAPARFQRLACGFGNLHRAQVGLAAKWAEIGVEFLRCHRGTAVVAKMQNSKRSGNTQADAA